MTKKPKKLTQISFNLHSFRNRRLYPISNYPLTHLLDRLNIDRRSVKLFSYVGHFIYAFILLLICVLIGTIFFRLHIQVYNTIFGPFHFNEQQFVDYVNKYEKDQLSCLWKIEYIQVELNENNIQNPTSKYDTIKQYSDPRTRRHHIATYKHIKHPSIYVKLPIHSQKHFHRHHPIHFQSYSIRTLQCIIKNLPLSSIDTYKTWVEKSDYVQYINKEYAKNATEFNKAVLTKCGILIGHLYRPIHERAFIPTREHKFYAYDIAINMTEEYYPFYSFLIGGLIFLWLFFKSLFYLILYLSNLIRFKFLHHFGIFSFALELLPDVVEELWLLNIDGSPQEQLLQLDKFIQKSEYKFTKNLTIIQNDDNQLFVVISKVNLNERLNVHDESSPFIICPVTDIQKVTQYGGICYGKDSSWIHWPAMTTNEQNYAGWLHEQLMEISEVYKQRYEKRLRYEKDDRLPSYFSDQPSGPHLRHLGGNRAIEHSRPLANLIREENNIQRLKIERQNIIENIENLRDPISPATAQFIAKFRLEHEHSKKIVNMDIEKKQIKCTLCQDDLKRNEFYAIWPCPGADLFHYDCMLTSLRTRNTCPNCRHAVEGIPRTSTQAKIQVDSSLKSVSFVDIESKTKLKGEEEILFNLNSLFKIHSVDLDDKLNLWKIELHTTNEGEEKVEQYLTSVKREMEEYSPIIYFGRLLLNELGQVDRAGKYFEMLLKMMGNIIIEQDLNETLEYYKRALSILEEHISVSHQATPKCFAEIACIYNACESYEDALRYYFKALQFEKQILRV